MGNLRITVNSGLFTPVTTDVLCGSCHGFFPAQWDAQERPQTVGWQFWWCPHELCWRCAGAVVEACPVCSASGPVGVYLERFEREALQTPMPEPEQRKPLWPWFLLAAVLSAGLIFWDKLLG